MELIKFFDHASNFSRRRDKHDAGRTSESKERSYRKEVVTSAILDELSSNIRRTKILITIFVD